MQTVCLKNLGLWTLALGMALSSACASDHERATPAPTPVASQSAELPKIRDVPKLDLASLPRVTAQLGVPPLAAPPTGRTSPAHVVVNLEVKEMEVEIGKHHAASVRHRPPPPLLRSQPCAY
mgnify:CR=1 FL=1